MEGEFSVIFGDGAGAAHIKREVMIRKEEFFLHTCTVKEKHARELTVEGPSIAHWVPEIFKQSRRPFLLSLYERNVCI